MWLCLITCIATQAAQIRAEFGGDFTNLPPEDYFQRRSLLDCPSRFYAHLPDHPKWVDVDHGNAVDNGGNAKHTAAIGWTANGTIEYLCSGTLITSKFILTTASCVSKTKRKDPDTVLLGNGKGQQVNVFSFKPHPQYRQGRHFFDVALIALETDVLFDGDTCPACLWLEEEVPTDDMQSIGFGAANFNGGSLLLTERNFSKIDMHTCTEQFPSFRRGLFHKEFCAKSDLGEPSERSNEGALQIERSDIDGSLIPLLVGIRSLSTSSCNETIALFTRFSSYRDWIEQEIGHSIDYQECIRTSQCPGRKQIPSLIIHHRGHTSRVGLAWNDIELDEYQCGATLIDYQFAVTSATCVYMKPTSPQFIIVRGTREIVPISQIIIHPSYGTEQPQNDIALLKLGKFLKLSTTLVPACLWLDGTKSEDWLLKISVYATVFSVRDAFRKDNYDQYTINFYPDELHECEALEYSHQDLQCLNSSMSFVPGVCNIDYGGPVFNVSGKITYLHGIVSPLSEGCGSKLVVVKIVSHIPWILETIFGYSKAQPPKTQTPHSNNFVNLNQANPYISGSTIMNQANPYISGPAITKFNIGPSFHQIPLVERLHHPSGHNLLTSIFQNIPFVRHHLAWQR